MGTDIRDQNDGRGYRELTDLLQGTMCAARSLKISKGRALAFIAFNTCGVVDSFSFDNNHISEWMRDTWSG